MSSVVVMFRSWNFGAAWQRQVVLMPILWPRLLRGRDKCEMRRDGREHEPALLTTAMIGKVCGMNSGM